VKTYTRDELFELAAAHAIGATTAEESSAIEAAMATSPELAAEVAAFREVSVSLAQQQGMQPSPSVRSAFLERVSESKHATITLPPFATVTRPSRWLPIGLAAAAAVAVAMGAWNVSLRRDVAARAHQVDSLSQQLALTSGEAEHRHKQLNTILEGEKDVYLVHLKNIDTVAGPGIQFFWNQRQHRGLLHAFRLKPAPPGRSYQLWFLVDGKPVSAKVFNSDADGHALVADIALPSSPEDVTDVLLTEEPAGGSPGPTTAPFVGGKMRAS
jgi:anti-sigma-K factor RskA